MNIRIVPIDQINEQLITTGLTKAAIAQWVKDLLTVQDLERLIEQNIKLQQDDQ